MWSVWMLGVLLAATGSSAVSGEVLMQPLRLRTESLSTDSIRIHWMDTQWDDDVEGRYFLIRYKPKSTKKFTYTNTTETDVVIDGLSANVKYKFQVKTFQGQSKSAWSYSIRNRTKPDETMVPSKMRPFYTFARPRQIIVEWVPPKSAAHVIGYQLGYGAGIQDGNIILFAVNTTETILNNLEPETPYVISLRAYNSVGDGPVRQKTVTTEEDTDLEPPLFIDVTVTSPRSAKVEVYDPESNRPGRIYELRWNEDGANTFAYKNTSNQGTHVGDLTPDQTYDVTARVYEGIRVSDWSYPPEQFKTLVIASPPILSASAVTGDPSSAMLTWTDPKEPDGTLRPSTSYIGWYTDDTSKPKGDWELMYIKRKDAKQHRYTVTGLEPETTYYFKIIPFEDTENPSALASFTTGPSN